MASRLARAAFLSSSFTLILVFFFSASVYKSPTSKLTNAHHFRRSANPKQQWSPQFVLGAAIGVPDLQSQREKQQTVDTMTTTSEHKRSWPTLVGLDAEEAKKKILEEQPHLHVLIVPVGSLMTMDFNTRRVRIFKDEHQKVASVPNVG